MVHLVDLIDKEKQEPSATRDRRMLRNWKNILILVKKFKSSEYFLQYLLLEFQKSEFQTLKNLPEGKKLPGIHAKVSIFVWRLYIGLALLFLIMPSY